MFSEFHEIVCSKPLFEIAISFSVIRSNNTAKTDVINACYLVHKNTLKCITEYLKMLDSRTLD